MCKAKNTIDQILQLCEEAEQFYKEQTKALNKLNQMQQDVLHMIENDNFNAAEGYCYAKRLKDIREERRLIKHEVETMLAIKPMIGNVLKQVKTSQGKVINLKIKYINLEY